MEKITKDLAKQTIDIMNDKDAAGLKRMYRDQIKTDDVRKSKDAPKVFLKNRVEHNEKEFLEILDKFQRKQYRTYCALFELQLDEEESLNDALDRLPSSGEEHISFPGSPAIDFTKNDMDFKLTRKLEGAIYENGRSVTIASLYPIFMRFFEVKGRVFVEVALDAVRSELRSGKSNFYVREINQLVEWLVAVGDMTVNPIDLSEVVERLNDKDEEANGRRTAQKMELMSGANATLDAGKDDAFTLPILGDLQRLISDKSELFDVSDATQEIKNVLEDFISSTQETSDLPWVSITWSNEVKSKQIKVKFNMASQTNQPYTLMYYYATSSGRGGMINVSNSLITEYCLTDDET